MNMKKKIVLCTAVLMGLGLVGCGDSTAKEDKVSVDSPSVAAVEVAPIEQDVKVVDEFLNIVMEKTQDEELNKLINESVEEYKVLVKETSDHFETVRNEILPQIKTNISEIKAQYESQLAIYDKNCKDPATKEDSDNCNTFGEATNELKNKYLQLEVALKNKIAEFNTNEKNRLLKIKNNLDNNIGSLKAQAEIVEEKAEK